MAAIRITHGFSWGRAIAAWLAILGLVLVPVTVAGRTFVPLRFLAEALGLKVGWDGETGSITLTEE